VAIPLADDPPQLNEDGEVPLAGRFAPARASVGLVARDHSAVAGIIGIVGSAASGRRRSASALDAVDECQHPSVDLLRAGDVNEEQKFQEGKKRC